MLLSFAIYIPKCELSRKPTRFYPSDARSSFVVGTLLEEHPFSPSVNSSRYILRTFDCNVPTLPRFFLDVGCTPANLKSSHQTEKELFA
jgi:hypothetical protein